MNIISSQVQWIFDNVTHITTSAEAKEELNKLKLSFLAVEIFAFRHQILAQSRDVRAKLLHFVNNRKRCSTSTENINKCMLKFPKLEVLRYDGRLEEWSTFETAFTEFVVDERIRDSDEAKRKLFISRP